MNREGTHRIGSRGLLEEYEIVQKPFLGGRVRLPNIRIAMVFVLPQIFLRAPHGDVSNGSREVLLRKVTEWFSDPKLRVKSCKRDRTRRFTVLTLW